MADFQANFFMKIKFVPVNNIFMLRYAKKLSNDSSKDTCHTIQESVIIKTDVFAFAETRVSQQLIIVDLTTLFYRVPLSTVAYLSQIL